MQFKIKYFPHIVIDVKSVSKVRLAEVSALDRVSLYEPFMYLASKLNPPPNKSALAQITSTIKR